MEQTLFVLKPDATIRRYVSAEVIKTLMKKYKVISFKEVKVSKDFSEIHYAEHRGKFFYDWVVNFLTIYDVVVLVLEGNNVIKGVRELLGKTIAQEAAPNTIRGKYGIWGGVNVAHASDSIESAEREIDLWKNNFDLIFDQKTAEDAVEKYLEKWNSNDNFKVMTDDMRRICKAYLEDQLTRERAIDELIMIINTELNENNVNQDNKVIQDFAEAVIENVKLSKK